MNKQEVEVVKQIGEQIGYGHLMTLASALWRMSLREKGYPESGAFVPTVMSFINDPEDREQQEAELNYYERLIEQAE